MIFIVGAKTLAVASMVRLWSTLGQATVVSVWANRVRPRLSRCVPAVGAAAALEGQCEAAGIAGPGRVGETEETGLGAASRSA